MSFTDCNHFSMSLSLSYWNITGTAHYQFSRNIVGLFSICHILMLLIFWSFCPTPMGIFSV